jgi:hypothetical protein
MSTTVTEQAEGAVASAVISEAETLASSALNTAATGAGVMKFQDPVLCFHGSLNKGVNKRIGVFNLNGTETDIIGLVCRVFGIANDTLEIKESVTIGKGYVNMYIFQVKWPGQQESIDAFLQVMERKDAMALPLAEIKL